MIAVDEPAEVAFIVAALVGGVARYRSLPTTNSLTDPLTLQTLYDEVRAFWDAHAVGFTTSPLV